MVWAVSMMIRSAQQPYHHPFRCTLMLPTNRRLCTLPPRRAIYYNRIPLRQAPPRAHRRWTTTATCFYRLSSVPKNYGAPLLGTLDWSILLSLFYERTDRLKNIRHPNCGSENDTSTANSRLVYATSSSSSWMESQSSFWSRWMAWIRQWLSQCRDILWVTVRGSEIVVRLVLPSVLVLIPASGVASYYYHRNNNNKDEDLNNWIADASWDYIRWTVTELGPAFVKLGQWMATRRDLFPVNVCQRLAVLQDAGHAHAWKFTHQALCEAFGDDYETRGLSVEPLSSSLSHSTASDNDDNNERLLIGCGSAAQVYKGTLRVVVNQNDADSWDQPASGSDSTTKSTSSETIVQHRPVAIKVLHPRLQERIDRDLWFVETVARLLHEWIPSERLRMLNLPRAVANFGSILRRQADLTLEADNLQRFRRNFYQHNHDNNTNDDNVQESKILFPRPMEGWISKNVLVEDLVDNATPIAEFLNDSTEEGIKIRRELASPLLRAFLKMVFIDNLSHGDLHAGNVLVQTSVVERSATKTWREKLLLPFVNMGKNTTSNDSSSSIQPSTRTEVRRQIVFLDAGIATTLSPNDQRNLLDLFRAVLLNDGNRAGRLMVERARYERCSHTPGGVEAFAHGIQELVSEFHYRRRGEAGLTLGAVRIGSLLSRVLDLCRVHGVEIDPAMASIVISTLVLEGLGRSLDPSLNLIDFAVPFVLGRGRV